MRPFTSEDYLEIWNRRKWWFLGAFFVVAVGTCIAAALLPRMYTSECLILLEGQPIESQSATADTPRPGSETESEQQLETLIQQTLSRTRLEQIMRDAGYISPAEAASDSQLETFRDAITIDILKNTDPRKTAAPPYGFKISYEDHKPKNAQRIANQLASFFVSERLKSQEQGAQESNEYLKSELDAATKDLLEKQQTLEAFKQRYSGQLPVDEQLNIQNITRLQTQLQSSQQAVERAREEEASIESGAQATSAGGVGSTQQATADSARSKLTADLGSLQSKLADLLSRDTPTHPDVIKTRAEIEHVKAELAAEQQADEKTAAATTTSKSDAKPVVENISASNRKKLDDDKAEIVARIAEQKRMQDEIARYQANLQAIPSHAQEYSDLDRALQDSKLDFDSLKKKVDDAQLVNDMEIRLQGQRFRIQDFASLPDTPTTPVYWKIDLGGLGAAFMVGLVLAGALEFGDTSMKSDRDVEYYLQTKNLAMVPELPLPHETANAREKQRRWLICSVPVVLLVTAVLVFLYYPLLRK